MPLHNERTLWFSNLSVAFADLAAEGSCSNEAYSMMQEHIKIMRSAVNEIKKREMTRQSGAASTTGSVPVVMHAMDVGGPGRNAALSIAATTAITPAGNPAIIPSALAATTIGNPPRSKVKGRKKEKRLKKGMNAEPKRKNKCSVCKSTSHNAARCPQKKSELLYADSLMVDNLEVPSTKPRIAAWSRKLLNQVIKLDTNTDGSFGKLKVCKQNIFVL
nr:unnamed protein product [Digitaria exilis]